VDNKFVKTYQEIVLPVASELDCFDEHVAEYFVQQQDVSKKSQIEPIIREFLAVKGKRLRPCLMFLLAKALDIPLTDFHYKLAMAQEFIHNATLIHDDIIDCSILRRGRKTINFEYDSKLAVLAGDFLLCEAMNILKQLDNTSVQNLHISMLYTLVNGEIEQYFNRYKLFTMEEYLRKTKAKTSALFETGLVSVMHYSDFSVEFVEKIRRFATNYGIAFQIRNDLDNFDVLHKTEEDIKNGDYNAPIIFYAQEKKQQFEKLLEQNPNKIINEIKKSSALNRTQEMIKTYVDNAIENISFIEDNLYKQSLINLCNLLLV
jgi:geranylgeranyl pyrophosphate synthase